MNRHIALERAIRQAEIEKAVRLVVRPRRRGERHQQRGSGEETPHGSGSRANVRDAHQLSQSASRGSALGTMWTALSSHSPPPESARVATPSRSVRACATGGTESRAAGSK